MHKLLVLSTATLALSLLGCDGAMQYTQELALVSQDDRVPFA